MSSELAWEARQRLDRHFGTDYHLPAPDASWTSVGTMTGGWSKASGFFMYRRLMPGVVAIAAKDLQCTGATVANGTTILAVAQGLPGSYQPSTNKVLVAYCDVLKVSGIGYEAAALKFVNDGSVQCLGVSTGATILSCYGLLYTDI